MSLSRNIATVGGATVMSRLLGFARDVGIAQLLGASALSDAYLAALQIPNLFRRLLADGALNSAFVPLWLRKREQDGTQAARAFGEAALGALLLGLGLFAVLGSVFAPLLVHLIAPGFAVTEERFGLAVTCVRLSIVYVVFAGVVALWAAVLNAEGRVAKVAAGVVIFNVAFLAFVLALIAAHETASPRTGVILSLAVTISGLAQLLVVGAAMRDLRDAPFRPRFRCSPDVRRFFARALPGMIAAGIPQLKLMAGAIIASSSASAVSWLYYANRLYELPLGIVSVALATVLMPKIATGLRAEAPLDFAKAQSRSFEIALGLALPAALALVILAEPIAAALFQRGAFDAEDTLAVSAALAAMAMGLPGHAVEKAFGAVSFAHEDTRTPMYAALMGLAVSIVAALLLFPAHGHVGVAAAIAISGWTGAAILGAQMIRRGRLALEPGGARRLTLIVAAALLMALCLAVGRHFAAPLALSALERTIALAGLIAGGLLVYAALLHGFGILRWRAFAASLRP